MELQNIGTTTTWNEAASRINSNNQKIGTELMKLGSATYKNKGYFKTLPDLQAAFPTATVGSKAFVGLSYPYAIYLWENNSWVNSGATGGDDSALQNAVDLNTEQTIIAAKTFRGGINMNNTRIKNVKEPTDSTDAANKQYVDDFVQTSLDAKADSSYVDNRLEQVETNARKYADAAVAGHIVIFDGTNSFAEIKDAIQRDIPIIGRFPAGTNIGGITIDTEQIAAATTKMDDYDVISLRFVFSDGSSFFQATYDAYETDETLWRVDSDYLATRDDLASKPDIFILSEDSSLEEAINAINQKMFIAIWSNHPDSSGGYLFADYVDILSDGLPFFCFHYIKNFTVNEVVYQYTNTDEYNVGWAISDMEYTIPLSNDIPVEKGEAYYSIVQKTRSSAENKAISENSVALGSLNIAGTKSYKWSTIDFSTKTITLVDTPSGIAANDRLSIVNKNHYDDCCKVVSVNGKNIVVDSLPFTAIVGDSGEDAKTIFVVSKPNVGNKDLGQCAFAEGGNTMATQMFSHAEGYGTKAIGQYSHAEGRETESAYAAHAEGRGTKALGIDSHAEGYSTSANGEHAHAEGTHASAVGNASHAEGNETSSEGSSSHAEGYLSISKGRFSHAEGWSSESIGDTSHAEGQNTEAKGAASHTEGYVTETGGDYTSNTKTPGNSTINGSFAHAEGNATIAQGIGSHAEGRNTFAKGANSHAEGLKTSAIGNASHAENNACTANGSSSHAEGFSTQANGSFSHAEGRETQATGANSHAEGYQTKALQYHSHAEGFGTEAKNYSEHAEGSFNVSHVHDTLPSQSTVHSVGIGTSDTDRKNATEIMKNGDVYVIGVGNYKGDNPVSATPLANFINSIKSDLSNLSSDYDMYKEHIQEQVSVLDSLARGAQRALVYADYSKLVTALNAGMIGTDVLPKGQSIYIQQLDVPDLWVSNFRAPDDLTEYTYTNDEDFLEYIKGGGWIGCHQLSLLETAKVDLSNTASKTEVTALQAEVAALKAIINEITTKE